MIVVREGSSATTVATGRIQSIDVLRGVVMMIMALDHIRDFFHVDAARFSPEDLTQTTVVLFFTRWITHFCAPVFIFFAGTSAYLALRRKNPATVGRFLWTRGVWLLVVETTFVQVGEAFNLSYDYVIWQVIWAIGWSMIALSVLRLLPWGILLTLSVATIAGHNAFDMLQPEQFGSLGWLWKILHVGFAPIQLADGHVALVIYPLIPWVAVMSAGYCFGRVMDYEANRRRRVLMLTGLALCVGYQKPAPGSWGGSPSSITSSTGGCFTWWRW